MVSFTGKIESATTNPNLKVSPKEDSGVYEKTKKQEKRNKRSRGIWRKK